MTASLNAFVQLDERPNYGAPKAEHQAAYGQVAQGQLEKVEHAVILGGFGEVLKGRSL